MKKILFITKSSCLGNNNKSLHFGWTREYGNVEYWGKGFTNTSLQSLKNKIDSFKPDFIYTTMKNKYKYWLPDLTTIKVPKIHVEVDTCYYDANDPWYKQFDKIYCRQAIWNQKNIQYNKLLETKKEFRLKLKQANTWINTPVLHWSITKKFFIKPPQKRKYIRFVGNYKKPQFLYRKKLQSLLRESHCEFVKISGINKYISLLCSTSALVCPTESNYGDYVPAKLFEFLASGAAVFTNCDLKTYGTPELKKYIIKYNSIDNLKYKLKHTNFTNYYNKAIKIMKERYIHEIRYRDLFNGKI